MIIIIVSYHSACHVATAHNVTVKQDDASASPA